MMNVDRLIALVEEKSPIWDKFDKRHSNLKYVDTLWDAIATELGVPKRAAKDKWKNLRDQFRFLLNKMPESRPGDCAGDNSYEPSWYYYKQLHFLKGQIKPRTSTANLSYSQMSQISNDGSFDEEIHNIKVEENDSSNSTDYSRNMAERASNDEELMEVEAKKLGLMEFMPVNNCKEEDDSEYFFKSLLPHMRQLLPREKMLCHMEIQRIVFKHVYDNNKQ